MKALGSAALLFIGVCARGQSGAGSAASAGSAVLVPAFEVVSIRADRSGPGHVSIDVSPDSFTGENVSVKNLLQMAYGIREGLISGLPGWAASAAYDVKAKIVEPDMEALKKLSEEQQRQMIVGILKDRFGLQAHVETKVLPLLELVLTKEGPKFKESAAAAGPREQPKADAGPGPGGITVRNGTMTVNAIEMAALVQNLEGQVNQTVIDRTGLNGKYDFELRWTPERVALSNAVDNGATDAPPSIYTALQEQLGLKLVTGKGPVKTLVVDRIEMPSEN